MEYLSPEVILLLVVVGTLAGLVDSIAGGGGLLALPTLLWIGIPPAMALGTNKLQGSFGTLAASYSFWRMGLVDPRQMLSSIASTFVGAVLGTALVQWLAAGLLAQLIPILLIGFALYFLLSPRISDQDATARVSVGAFAAGVTAPVGFYDGFFGPGTGSFFTVAYVALLGYNLTRATAHSKILNFTSNIAALAAFIIGDSVLWTVGLIMATGQFAGAWIGSRLAIRHGARLIRPLLVLMSVGVSVKLLLEA